MTAILGTDEAMLQTQFKQANHDRQARGGGQLSPYTSHIHKYRHLSGPGRDSHLPVDHSYKTRVPMMHVNLKLLFCDWGRQISLVFIFLPIHYVLC
jgi:hypothetical protein